MTTSRRAAIRYEPLVMGAVIFVLIALSLFGPPAAPERGIWGSPYLQMALALCAAGFALIVWCGLRYFRHALRVGQVLGRGGLVFRESAPIDFWVTLLIAMWVFLFSGIFCVAIAMMFLLRAGAFS